MFADAITSRQNPQIIRAAKLSDKKYRDAEHCFRLDGVKLAREALSSGLSILNVFLSSERADKIIAELPGLLSLGQKVIPVTDEIIEKITDEKAPQGIVTVAEQFETLSPDLPLPKGDFRGLFLSEIRDPGNLGTIIRTANALGLDRVFLSADCADLYSPKTLRAAMGTLFRQPITIFRDGLSGVSFLQREGVTVYAAALHQKAKTLGNFPLPKRVCFAVGNEGHGLSEALIAASDDCVIIPMAEGCESLNAAMAATLLSWEMSRESLLQKNFQ